jgi:hypothetical protein
VCYSRIHFSSIAAHAHIALIAVGIRLAFIQWYCSKNRLANSREQSCELYLPVNFRKFVEFRNDFIGPNPKIFYAEIIALFSRRVWPGRTGESVAAGAKR